MDNELQTIKDEPINESIKENELKYIS